MIRSFLSLLARILLETAIVFLAVGAVLCVLAYRVARHLVTNAPGKLETVSAKAEQANALLGALFPRITRPAAATDDPEEPEE